MTPDPSDAWVLASLDLLSEFQFAPQAVDVLRRAPIRLVRVAALAEQSGPEILLPVDAPELGDSTTTWSVPFGTTALRMWNRVERPGPEWTALPSDQAPLWWRHSSGTLTPAWNLWGNIRDLLSFGEERRKSIRDVHGRFPADASFRSKLGVLDVPTVNDANAVLLDAATALLEGRAPRLSLSDDAVLSPGVVLSHDCDQLRGNDLITQAIRVLRAGQALVRGSLIQSGRHAKATLENAMRPRRYFAGNLAGMIDLERQFAFSSISYFLTGKGGRFGARSGNRIAQQYAANLPRGWEVGIHYNYGTVGDDARMRRELNYIASAIGAPVTAGRAHYLKFDPVSGPDFIARHGIRYDESVGWASHLSYRAGIAGPFYPLDQQGRASSDVLEMPMTCMDAALVATDFEDGFRSLYDHLRAIGGLISVLIHPGAFFNPEYPVYSGVYERILSKVFSAGGRSWTPSQLLQSAERWQAARRTSSTALASV